jgi:hypothetical protein
VLIVLLLLLQLTLPIIIITTIPLIFLPTHTFLVGMAAYCLEALFGSACLPSWPPACLCLHHCCMYVCEFVR